MTIQDFTSRFSDYSMTAAKQMPVILIETMNGTPERNNSRYELAGFSEEAKRQWREAHWEEDLQKAFEAGKQMAV